MYGRDHNYRAGGGMEGAPRNMCEMYHLGTFRDVYAEDMPSNVHEYPSLEAVLQAIFFKLLYFIFLTFLCCIIIIFNNFR